MRALIFVAEGVEDLEVFYPYYRIQERGLDVDLAGSAKNLVTAKHGYTLAPNKTFAELRAENYDLLIIPGGKAPEAIRLDEKALAVTKAMVGSGKVVAAICHGVQVLISAGVVKGRTATCWKGVRDDLKAAGGTYIDREVVVDGKLVTSRCPDDLPDFCREIFNVLE